MSSALYPPFESGATIVPRQLNRWLDVNRQGGPLARTSTYITIPSVSLENSAWIGHSELVGYFSYTASRNFALVTLPVVVNDSATICIAYSIVNELGYLTTVRYSLHRSPYDVIYFELPEYNNQPIAKNFRIEVWNTYWPESDPVVGMDISYIGDTLYTTVKGNLDYRFGLDSALAMPSIQAAYGNLIVFNPVVPMQDINGNDMFDVNDHPIEPISGNQVLYRYTTSKGDRIIRYQAPGQISK